jgi:hypothetical protein
MYVRTNPAAPIQWEPSDTDAAADAIATVDGTGITDPANASMDDPVELDDATAADVRAKYAELIDGGSS